MEEYNMQVGTEQFQPAPNTSVPAYSVDLYDVLAVCVKQKASDLHLTSGEPPVLRIDGQLRRMNLPVLNARDLKVMIYSVLTDEQQIAFERDLELDFALSLPGLERFRINVHRQKGVVEAAIRRVPLQVPTLERLGLPSIVSELSRKPNGLVLVTGPTGMGKTTTLAAMVELINTERECLVITIEDPVELVYENKRSIIKQREVSTDTHSFSAALRYAMRQDPDVIVVGEMRDLETISTALTAAETGHLVLATVHTPDAPQTISRIIDVFPSNQQEQIKLQIADSLQGIVSQLLLPSSRGVGRVMATEIMIATPAIRNLIREQQIQQIPSVIQTGTKHGMHTMDKSLLDLYRCGMITKEVALSKAKDPEHLLG